MSRAARGAQRPAHQPRPIWCRSTRAGARSSGRMRRRGRSIPITPSRSRCAQQTFEDTAAGKPIDVVTVRDLVQVLIHKVARSNAALGQILAVKQYENLTYCHSVNVSMLSLLLGKQVGLDEADAGGARRSRAAARRGQDADSARHRQEGRRARQAERRDDRVAHDAWRGDPRPDRRAASADADRRARASPRREGHGLSGSRRRDPASHEPDRVGRGHLRGDHRRANLSGADAAGARVPDHGAPRRREAEHRRS